MTYTASVSALAPEFEDFLFAPIGEDGNGMLLSVISALARLDLDPWQEAADLARLPGAAATRRLASLIAALPDLPLPRLDPITIATRLIVRLPHLTGTKVASIAAPLGVGMRRAVQSYSFRYIILILMVFVLGCLSITASRLSAARLDNVSVPASGTEIPQASPPTSGR